MSTKIDNIAKKITIGSLNSVRQGFKDVKETETVARIYGRADSFEAKDSTTMGVSYKFTGDFIGVNRYGEMTAAPVCFLVSPADTMLVNAIKDAEASGGKGVEFAFDFVVVPNPTAVLGYEYKVKPLLETKPAQPLLALAASITAPPIPVKARPTQLALPAGEAAQASAETAAATSTAETAATESAEQKAEEKHADTAKGKGKGK